MSSSNPVMRVQTRLYPPKGRIVLPQRTLTGAYRRFRCVTTPASIAPHTGRPLRSFWALYGQRAGYALSVGSGYLRFSQACPPTYWEVTASSAQKLQSWSRHGRTNAFRRFGERQNERLSEGHTGIKGLQTKRVTENGSDTHLDEHPTRNGF